MLDVLWLWIYADAPTAPTEIIIDYQQHRQLLWPYQSVLLAYTVSSESSSLFQLSQIIFWCGLETIRACRGFLSWAILQEITLTSYDNVVVMNGDLGIWQRGEIKDHSHVIAIWNNQIIGISFFQIISPLHSPCYHDHQWCSDLCEGLRITTY